MELTFNWETRPQTGAADSSRLSTGVRSPRLNPQPFSESAGWANGEESRTPEVQVKLPDLQFFLSWSGWALLVLWLWLVSQTAGSAGETKKKQKKQPKHTHKHFFSERPACRCSLPQEERSLSRAHSLSLNHHPGRSSRCANTGETQTGHGTGQGNTSV